MHLRVLMGAMALLLVVAPARAATVGPCTVFPPGNVFDADISGLPKHRKSDLWMIT